MAKVYNRDVRIAGGGKLYVGETEVVDASGNIKANIQDTLAQGSMYVGNSSNVTSEVDFSGNGKIPVGNGTTVTSQTMGGDASINGTGTVTVTQAAGAFDVKGGLLSSTKTDDGATGAAVAAVQISASPAANDVPGAFISMGKDDATNDTIYAQFAGVIEDPTDGAEIGSAAVQVQNGTGSLADAATFEHDGSNGKVSTGAVLTDLTVGTANGTVVAEEYGDGRSHTTVLTLTAEAVPGPAGGGNEDMGYLLYTFPAGAHVHEVTYMDVALQGGGVVDADTPEVGIGSVIAAGASATLAGTEMDYVTAQVATDCSGTATVAGPLGATAGVLTGISLNTAANAKTVHLNYADNWAGADTLAATGTVVLKWTSMA